MPVTLTNCLSNNEVSTINKFYVLVRIQLFWIVQDCILVFLFAEAVDENGLGDPSGVSRTPLWLDEVFHELSTASSGKQIAFGGFSGWSATYSVVL